MKRYIYKGTSPFVGPRFVLSPGDVITFEHPAVAFGVALEEIDPEVVPEPVVVEEFEDDAEEDFQPDVTL